MRNKLSRVLAKIAKTLRDASRKVSSCKIVFSNMGCSKSRQFKVQSLEYFNKLVMMLLLLSYVIVGWSSAKARPCHK